MVYFGKSDRMIKISGKVDKSDTYKWFTVIFRSLFTELLPTKPFLSHVHFSNLRKSIK